MGWSRWWRTIPPELAVPVVLYAAVEVVSAALVALGAAGGTGAASGLANAILVLCGLLELRRRVGSRPSRWLVVAGVLQMAAAATAIANSLIPLVVPRTGVMAVYSVTGSIQFGLTLGFVIALITAVRAWRSVLAPVALVAAFAWRMPPAIAEPALAFLPGLPAVRLYFAAALVVAQLLLLALYGRLGAVAQPRRVPVDAERAARRVASWLRWRVALAALLAGGVAATLVTGAPVAPRELNAGLLLVAGAAVAGELVGLIGLARARVIGLSPAALYAAAFAALWETIVALLSLYGTSRRGTAVIGLLIFIVGAGCSVWAGQAARRFAVRSGNRALRTAITRRFAALVVLEILRGATGLAAPLLPFEGQLLMLVIVGWSTVCQCGAMLALASVFARLAGPLRLAQVVEEF